MFDVILVQHVRWCTSTGFDFRSVWSPGFYPHLVRYLYRWNRYPDGDCPLYCSITIGRFIAGLGVGALSGMCDYLYGMTSLGSLLDSNCSSVQWGDGAKSHAWNASRAVPVANHHRVSARTFGQLCEASI